ncbi:MAG: radical SAM protein [Calditrichaeota bacterium]|nr:radical SAM protein [Calditrichota bacterium]
MEIAKAIQWNEILPGRLIRALLRPKRLVNLIKASAALLVSSLIKKPVVWGIPPVLTIEPTNQCNLRCPLCTTGAGEMERPVGRLSPETFEHLMELLGDYIFFLLIYHQGEPYMNKHFFDFVRLAKRKGIYVTTSTNGHFFTPANVEKTIESGLDSMIISIDGVTQSSYAHYRVGGDLQRVIEGTRLLMETRRRLGSRTPNVAIQFLVMKHNEHEIPAMKRLAEELGVDRFLVKNIEVHSMEEARFWLPDEEAFRRYEIRNGELVVKGVSEKQNCPRLWLSTLMNWDGTIVPCCFDKNGKYVVGNIHSVADFRAIWKGPQLQAFRQQHLRDRQSIDICRNCNQGFGSFLPDRLWQRWMARSASQPAASHNLETVTQLTPEKE